MNTQRIEGAVIVLLLAVSTITAVLIVSVSCMVGGRFFKFEREQEVRAGVTMLEESVLNEEHEADVRSFLV